MITFEENNTKILVSLKTEQKRIELTLYRPISKYTDIVISFNIASKNKKAKFLWLFKSSKGNLDHLLW